MEILLIDGKRYQVSDKLLNFHMKVTPGSKNISAIGVNTYTLQLYVLFHNGGQYMYNDVSLKLLQGALNNLDGIGKYLSMYIIGPKQIPYEKLTELMITPEQIEA